MQNKQVTPVPPALLLSALKWQKALGNVPDETPAQESYALSTVVRNGYRTTLPLARVMTLGNKNTCSPHPPPPTLQR